LTQSAQTEGQIEVQTRGQTGGSVFGFPAFLLALAVARPLFLVPWIPAILGRQASPRFARRLQ
jgi:hypothetical protein